MFISLLFYCLVSLSLTCLVGEKFVFRNIGGSGSSSSKAMQNLLELLRFLLIVVILL